MSLPERQVCLLALYHPQVFDIHEQHMLHLFDAPHPLAGRPDTQHATLLPFKGTVNVTQRLNCLSQHPTLWVDDGQPELSRLPFPYLGDLLVFLKDEQGPYCVNWSVKARYEDFLDLKHLTDRKRPTKPIYVDGQPLALRHRIEKQYFDDANIPTHLIGAGNLDTHMLENLRALYVRSHQRTTLPADAQTIFVDLIQEIVGTRQTVLSMLPTLISKLGITREDCLTAFYQAIWHRQLRVDLYAPILPDKPLRPERSDLLSDLSHLFTR
jgi:hypothetical protein